MKCMAVVSAVVLCAAPAFAQQPQTITCATQGTGQQVCPANTRDGVLLVREQSANVCRQGTTWTYDRRGITVSGGCSADFLVSGRGNRGPNQGNGYGDNGYNNGAGGNYNNNGQGNGGQIQGNNGQGYGNGQGYNGGNSQGYNGQGSAGNAPQQPLTPIPQGTQIGMQLDQAVRLNELSQGDFVTGTLTNDVSVGGRVIAPAGTPVQAKVLSAPGATLDLRLDSLHVNNQTYPLQSNSVRGLRDAVSTGDSTARGGFGAVLGTLANAGTLPAGTVFNFRLTATSRPTLTN